MKIGNAIRQMREHLGLKLEAVAAEAGFDAGNLSRIETCKQQPSVARLEKIAHAMGVGVSDLYRLIEPGGPVPPLQDPPLPYQDDLQGIRRHFASLDVHHRKMVVDFVKLAYRAQKGTEAASKAAAHEQTPA